jgi:HD-like signal output (HDOD) protein
MWERKLLGFDNAQAGAAILERWNFPDEILIPVLCQLDPLKAPSLQAWCCQLSISRALAPFARGKVRAMPDLDSEVVEGAGLSMEKIFEAIDDARVGLQEMDTLFR